MAWLQTVLPLRGCTFSHIASQVYERGATYAPSCVDHWVNYLTFILEAHGRAAANPAIILNPTLVDVECDPG